jgi:hypothetical protein
MEEQHTKQLLDSGNIIFYTRYVDDILIIYNSNKIQPKLIETHMKQIHSNIKLECSVFCILRISFHCRTFDESQSSMSRVFNLSDIAGHINNFNDARGPQSYTAAFRIVSCFPDTQRTKNERG